MTENPKSHDLNSPNADNGFQREGHQTNDEVNSSTDDVIIDNDDSNLETESIRPLRPNYYHREEVMGTVFEISVYDTLLSEVTFRKLVERAAIEWSKIDFMFSTYKHDSFLTKYRTGLIKSEELPEEFEEIFDLSSKAKKDTYGFFDPWSMPGGFDPTGLVKGWSIEIVSEYFYEEKVKCFMINAGGDIKTFGIPKNQDFWQFGIRSPFEPAGLTCVIQTIDSVATSGDYERPGQLIDPFTLDKNPRAASATVTGPSLTFADAYATALVIAGTDNMDWIYDLDGYEAFIVGKDGEEVKTDNLKIAEET